MARKITLHPDVVTREYKGYSVRFRKVENSVYIPIVDLHGFLRLNSCNFSVYSVCGSVTRIQFVKLGSGNLAIEQYDLENFARQGRNNTIQSHQKEKIAWLREVCKEIKEIPERIAQDKAMKIFTNPEFGDVRVVKQEDEIWFCLADICEALKLSNPSRVKSRLDEADTQLIDLHALTFGYPKTNGNSEATFINETALYEVILRSNSEKVKPFRKWVTKEVLPSIRRTGAYISDTPEDTPETIMAKGLLAAKEALDRMERRALAAENGLLEAKPKVRYYDTVITAHEVYTSWQLASELKMSYWTLRHKLYELGIVVSETGPLEVRDKYKKWVELGTTTKKKPAKCLKWNKEGRNNILVLIDPDFPI